MEKRTAEIIMVLKGNHDLGERDTLKQYLAAYMSDRCDYPENEYTDDMLFGITREAVIDFIRGCYSDGQRAVFLYDYFEAKKWHEDETSCWLSALSQVQVREKLNDGTYSFINGFTEENTTFVHSEAKSRN